MTYEYVCTACHHEWEASQSISEPALTECPKCHGATAKRQVSGGTGFVLKGGGWYSDLYSSAKPKASSSSDASSDSPKTESPKTESKGDSTTPATSAS